MKNWIQIPLAAAVAALVAVGVALFTTPERRADAADDAFDASALQRGLDELEREHSALAERLATLSSTSATPAPATRASAEDLERAIADFMARQLLETADDDAPGELATRAPTDLESAAIADKIVSGELEDDELEALWQRLRDEDKIDAVVAEIERQAALEPTNPDLASELGKAYLQKLFDVGIGPMAAAWGEKADHAFDRALELDETHWEARFNKALSLSNWPEFLGKQGEAIRHFEILMDQQEQRAASAEHAWTYFFLGNMYDQNGDHEQALAAWKRGYERFPDNSDLREKMEGR